MKNAILVFAVLLGTFAQAQSTSKKTTAKKMDQTIYQFKVEDLYGKTFDFATLKGKKILIVNTASKCGLTPQYKDLEKIYKELDRYNLIDIDRTSKEDFIKVYKLDWKDHDSVIHFKISNVELNFFLRYRMILEYFLLMIKFIKF